MAKGGFTQAELAAAEWAKHERKREREKYRSLLSSPMSDPYTHRKRKHKTYERQEKKKHLRRSSMTYSLSNSSSSSTIPQDPHNPLHEAHRVQLYYSKHRQRVEKQPLRKPFRSSNRDNHYTHDGSMEPVSYSTRQKNIERWEHDVFENRSESPIRERTEGSMWDTRRGSWRSRAGGVYLPESPRENDDTKELVTTTYEKPSRYKYPLRNKTSFSSILPATSKRCSPLRIPQSRDSPVYE